MAARHPKRGTSVFVAARLFLMAFLPLLYSSAKLATADDSLTESGEYRFQSARAAAQAGEYELAKQEYARLMLEEPDNVDYMFGYAQVLFWSDDIPRSRRFLEQARKLAPDYEVVWKLEYRALLILSGDQSNVSVDHYREMAAQRFPHAEWYRKVEQIDPTNYHWEFSASREQLDNDTPDWEQAGARFGRKVAATAMLYLAASTYSRFGATDTQFGLGSVVPAIGKWTIMGGVTVSSSPNFLPDTELDLGINRRFDHGWVGGIRWRHRDYTSSPVDSFAAVVERYFGDYRVAYSLDSAHLSSEHAIVHVVAASFYPESGFQLGVTLAAGEEIEMIAPGQLLKTDVTSVAISGRHPVSNYLSVGWRLTTHRQGALYRRTGIGVSVSGDF